MTNLNSSILDVKTITEWKPDRLEKQDFFWKKVHKKALQRHQDLSFYFVSIQTLKEIKEVVKLPFL